MGHSTYSNDDYKARSDFRASTGRPTFAFDADIKSGAAPAKVHDTLSPFGVKIRECRDSVAHPISVPVAMITDTTGSMAEVPQIIQASLPKLMGAFLNDKVSGKRYLGDGYPAILIGAVDDYNAMIDAYGKPDGCLQVGQFESGLEIDDNLTNLWLTKNGGGTYEENYELALYFLARHTAHDHWEKRGRKGHAFIAGDEHAYGAVTPERVLAVFGDTIQGAIPLRDIVAEVQERYHLYFVLPRMTQHYEDNDLVNYWVDLLGQQNMLRLPEPDKICELVVATVAIAEEHVGVDDVAADLGAGEYINALVPLARAGGSLSRYSAAGLPAVAGSAGGVDRL